MTKPPGHTCPAIDKAQSAMRKLAWRCRHPQHESSVTVDDLVDSGLAALEQIREENRQMRAAYWDMHKRLTAAGLSVTETPVAFVRYKDLEAPTLVCVFCDHSMRVHNGDCCYECGADDGVCKKDT